MLPPHFTLFFPSLLPNPSCSFHYFRSPPSFTSFSISFLILCLSILSLSLIFPSFLLVPHVLHKNFHELRHGVQSPDVVSPASSQMAIDFEEFYELVLRLCVRQEILYLLDQYATLGNSCLTAKELMRFVHYEQQVSAVY